MSPRVRLGVACALSALTLPALVTFGFTTHSLLLVLESYHQLYNVLSLLGCLTSLYMTRGEAAARRRQSFGWARLEVLTSVMSLLFLAALLFSASVEAVQVMVEGFDEQQNYTPLPMLVCAAALLVVNLLSYALIGGYSNVQASSVTGNGDDKARLPALLALPSEEKSSSQEKSSSKPSVAGFRHRLGRLALFILRDLCGAVLITLCAVLAHLELAPVARFLDPAATLLCAIILSLSSLRIYIANCLVMLQATPPPVDIPRLSELLRRRFDCVLRVHELHVWQLTPTQTVGTAHLVFARPVDYTPQLLDQLLRFFRDHGVDSITLQPEFETLGLGKSGCLLDCSTNDCVSSRCCREADRPPPFSSSPPPPFCSIPLTPCSSSPLPPENTDDLVVAAGSNGVTAAYVNNGYIS